MPRNGTRIDEDMDEEGFKADESTGVVRTVQYAAFLATKMAGLKPPSAPSVMQYRMAVALAQDLKDVLHEEELKEVEKKRDEAVQYLVQDQVVTFVKPGQYVPYKQQGNPKYNTDRKIAERLMLRKSVLIREVVEAFWGVSDIKTDRNGVLTQEAYFNLSNKLHRALVPDIDDAEIQQSAESDYQRDTENYGLLNFQGFFNSMFELADTWTVNIDELEYAAFLWILLDAVTDMNIIPWKFKKNEHVDCILDMDMDEMLAKYRCMRESEDPLVLLPRSARSNSSKSVPPLDEPFPLHPFEELQPLMPSIEIIVEDPQSRIEKEDVVEELESETVANPVLSLKRAMSTFSNIRKEATNSNLVVEPEVEDIPAVEPVSEVHHPPADPEPDIHRPPSRQPTPAKPETSPKLTPPKPKSPEILRPKTTPQKVDPPKATPAIVHPREPKKEPEVMTIRVADIMANYEGPARVVRKAQKNPTRTLQPGLYNFQNIFMREGYPTLAKVNPAKMGPAIAEKPVHKQEWFCIRPLLFDASDNVSVHSSLAERLEDDTLSDFDFGAMESMPYDQGDESAPPLRTSRSSSGYGRSQTPGSAFKPPGSGPGWRPITPGLGPNGEDMTQDTAGSFKLPGLGTWKQTTGNLGPDGEEARPDGGANFKIGTQNSLMANFGLGPSDESGPRPKSSHFRPGSPEGQRPASSGLGPTEGSPQDGRAFRPASGEGGWKSSLPDLGPFDPEKKRESSGGVFKTGKSDSEREARFNDSGELDERPRTGTRPQSRAGKQSLPSNDLGPSSKPPKLERSGLGMKAGKAADSWDFALEQLGVAPKVREMKKAKNATAASRKRSKGWETINNYMGGYDEEKRPHTSEKYAFRGGGLAGKDWKAIDNYMGPAGEDKRRTSSVVPSSRSRHSSGLNDDFQRNKPTKEPDSDEKAARTQNKSKEKEHHKVALRNLDSMYIDDESEDSTEEPADPNSGAPLKNKKTNRKDVTVRQQTSTGQEKDKEKKKIVADYELYGSDPYDTSHPDKRRESTKAWNEGAIKIELESRKQFNESGPETGPGFHKLESSKKAVAKPEHASQEIPQEPQKVRVQRHASVAVKPKDKPEPSTSRRSAREESEAQEVKRFAFLKKGGHEKEGKTAAVAPGSQAEPKGPDYILRYDSATLSVASGDSIERDLDGNKIEVKKTKEPAKPPSSSRSAKVKPEKAEVLSAKAEQPLDGNDAAAKSKQRAERVSPSPVHRAKSSANEPATSNRSPLRASQSAEASPKSASLNLLEISRKPRRALASEAETERESDTSRTGKKKKIREPSTSRSQRKESVQSSKADNFASTQAERDSESPSEWSENSRPRYFPQRPARPPSLDPSEKPRQSEGTKDKDEQMSEKGSLVFRSSTPKGAVDPLRAYAALHKSHQEIPQASSTDLLPMPHVIFTERTKPTAVLNKAEANKRGGFAPSEVKKTVYVSEVIAGKYSTRPRSSAEKVHTVSLSSAFLGSDAEAEDDASSVASVLVEGTGKDRLHKMAYGNGMLMYTTPSHTRPASVPPPQSQGTAIPGNDPSQGPAVFILDQIYMDPLSDESPMMVHSYEAARPNSAEEAKNRTLQQGGPRSATAKQSRSQVFSYKDPIHLVSPKPVTAPSVLTQGPRFAHAPKTTVLKFPVLGMDNAHFDEMGSGVSFFTSVNSMNKPMTAQEIAQRKKLIATQFSQRVVSSAEGRYTTDSVDTQSLSNSTYNSLPQKYGIRKGPYSAVGERGHVNVSFTAESSVASDSDYDDNNKVLLSRKGSDSVLFQRERGAHRRRSSATSADILNGIGSIHDPHDKGHRRWSYKNAENQPKSIRQKFDKYQHAPVYAMDQNSSSSAAQGILFGSGTSAVQTMKTQHRAATSAGEKRNRHRMEFQREKQDAPMTRTYVGYSRSENSSTGPGSSLGFQSIEELQNEEMQFLSKQIALLKTQQSPDLPLHLNKNRRFPVVSTAIPYRGGKPDVGHIWNRFNHPPRGQNSIKTLGTETSKSTPLLRSSLQSASLHAEVKLPVAKIDLGAGFESKNQMAMRRGSYSRVLKGLNENLQFSSQFNNRTLSHMHSENGANSSTEAQVVLGVRPHSKQRV